MCRIVQDGGLSLIRMNRPTVSVTNVVTHNHILPTHPLQCWSHILVYGLEFKKNPAKATFKGGQRRATSDFWGFQQGVTSICYRGCCIRDQFPRDIVKPAGMKYDVNSMCSVERKHFNKWVKAISFWRNCVAASVGEWYTKIWFIKGVVDVNWPPYRDWKADVSSVSPSSERIDELWVV